jgi:hypothetical protein
MLNYHTPKRDFFSVLLRKRGLGRKWSSPCRRDGEVEKSALRAVFLFFPKVSVPR